MRRTGYVAWAIVAALTIGGCAAKQDSTAGSDAAQIDGAAQE